MAVAVPTTKLYEEFIEFFIDHASPEAILTFKLSDAAQDRLHDLLDRNNEGSITPQELFELDAMVQFDQLMGLLKVKAIAALKSHGARP